MAMQKSDELAETAYVLYEQFGLLGENPEQLTIGIIDETHMIWEFWLTLGGNQINHVFKAPIDEPIVLNKSYLAWKEKKRSLVIDISGDELKAYYNFFKSLPGYKEYNDFKKSQSTEQRRVLHYAFFSKGLLALASAEPKPTETIQLLERFAGVLEQTYTRFLDLQKAEAQARESHIEAALERVRSRTMGMQNSEELKEVIQLVYEQFVHLNIHIEHTGFILDYKTRDDLHIWLADQNEMPSEITIPCFDSPPNNSIKVAKEKGENFFAYLLTFEEKNKFYQELFKFIPGVPQESLEYYFNCPGLAGSGILLENIGLYIENFSGTPYTNEENAVLMRFGKVFQQTYTRFLDLKKAEAQAREAQIEAALERVRSLALGMRKSEEVGNVTDSFFNEFNKLSVDVIGCSIVVIEENKDNMELWRARSNVAVKPFESSSFNKSMNILKKYLPEWFPKFYSALEERKNHLIEEMSSNTRLQFINSIAEQYNYSEKEKSKLFEVTPENISAHFLFFKLGYLALLAEEKLPDENLAIARRFIEAFAFAYTRFIDLQKAEAQAREAEIEAALERVRSRTMAMQKSDELAETASHLFGQLNVLGIKPYRFNIAIVDTISEKCQLWSTTNEGKVIPTGPLIPLKEYNVFNQMYDGWKQQLSVNVIRIEGEERITWTKYIMRYVSFNEYKPENIDLERLRHEPAIFSNFFFKQGFVVVHTTEEINESDMKIIQRFVNVFEQTYTRFLDLQRAEEQTREAKIEASLERVRSKAMAMHSPNDLSDTVNIFFKELKALRIIPIRCGVAQIDEATRTTSLTTTTSSQQGDSFEVIGKIKQTGHPVLDGIFENWKLQKEYHPVLEGEDIKAYYDVMNSQIVYPDYSEETKQFGNLFPFQEGFVFAWTENKLSEEELQIFRRFTSVLSLTYRRYIDLKEAEVRTFEAVRQASLDRIRAEIASMRTSEDLNRITPIIWRELKNLEVPFFRCGVFIVDEESNKVRVYLTTPDGKSLGVLNLPFESSKLTKSTVEFWKQQKVYHEHWNKDEFIKWTKSMIERGQVQNATTYQGSAEPPESLDLHFVPFSQGMLYVGDTSPLTEDKLELVKTLAEAFSIAYARYEDFKNLEEAKNKIEITLSELKSAQAQLVHSEKMASLGELTAGIAHEIKNPLNFVNNFSEVSRELLDEMKVEIQNNNIEEVIELVEDLKQNLGKINTHGKRADSIVKGMLLHSRGTSGEKVLTNINDLLDQYVTLAYHGLRAQDKEFNITIEKDYDGTLEKVNVVPQDISRVFLNIINNACYAAFDKKKKRGNEFSPTLKVISKNLNDKVEIRIADNGDGIPESIKKQIFNPFFTTKPTGEGTGLGLSLSYDIVTKVHGGNIKVESEEGKGAMFIIQLPLS
ncbi:MAG: ATP-binding protein [Ignavibacteriaceae bacterium]|nr:ATP-binding protein [Ignavibacteriaceae bacterium]